MARLYLDMDGVLADFDKRAEGILHMPTREFEAKYGSEAFWFILGRSYDFFNTFDPMPDAYKLWTGCTKWKPSVLTGLPKGDFAEHQKRRWVARNLGSDVEVICCKSKDKSNYCNPGDVLVDDRTEYRHLWMAKGGHYVVHTDADTSLKALEVILA